MHYFQTKLDGVSKLITVLVCITMLIPFISITQQAIELHQPIMFVGPVVIVVFLALAFLYRTTAYSLDGGLLSIHRAMGSKQYVIKEFSELRLITQKELGASIPFPATAGIAGYSGIGIYKSIGKAFLAATDREKLILLKAQDGRQLIISPDDTQGFLAAFNKLRK